ncbi:MAG: hypothetical protein GXO62_06490 [Epsilonproteobacteria bacterium]|nr:hypothetical protein [Campylobacterota bacterium]
MAEENVVIIEEEQEEKKGGNNKLIFIIVAVLIVVLILLLVLLLVVVMKKKKEEQNQNFNIKKIVKKLEKKKNIPKDELKELIKKANILYKQGEKQKALQILNKISEFSKTLSNYNLGVIKLEEKNYKKAIDYFQKAIANKDSIPLSAINAAYAALMLKDYKLFNYYKNLAYTFLPQIAKNKNYPYYYAIIMYYMGYEFEALKALQYKTQFDEESKKLKANILEYYSDPKNANVFEEDPFYKGMDLARIGEYTLARNYLSRSKNDQAQFALALVDLKLSQFKEASGILKKYRYNNIYPIYMYLKKSLFDIKTAQKEFKESFLKKPSDFFDLFFYFAPYKVFNLNQTINYLKKGISGLPIGAIEEAKTFLSKSVLYSSLNLKISKAIKLALNGHIYLANKAFKKLVKENNTYILHYDTALTYAQLGDYKNAYMHFLRAYHLNPYDLISGIYALFAAKKTDINNPHLVALIKESFNEKTILEDGMLSFYLGDRVKMSGFLAREEKNNITWMLTRLGIKAMFFKNYSHEALKIKSMFDKDLIANLLYFYSKNNTKPINILAQNYQGFYFRIINNVNLNDFYYGAKVAKEWFFEFAKISGLMYRVRNLLIKKSQTEVYDIVPILKRLAYANLYTKHFEEAYTIYNDLINNKNITDPHTLYHAAVSAIGANHHANAVALMELAKLKNPKYYEARYGLGLLWQEANNLNAASIQYGKIANGFSSKFFDFNVQPKR